MSKGHKPRRGYVRLSGWRSVSHGLHMPVPDAEDPRIELEAWRLVLPAGGAFTHLTAAREFGWWLPPLPHDTPVFASVPNSGTRPRRSGLVVSRHTQPIPVEPRQGLPFVTAEEALLACARDLGLLDMVVLVDAALHLGPCTSATIAEAASLRRRGATGLSAALKLADARSESAWESLLRLLHVVCDVPVDPQVEIFDDGGLLLARADLRIRGTNTLHEYDGGEHRKKSRQRKDLARERRLGDTLATRRGYTDQEVLHQGVSILRDADRSLGREHRPERIRAWHALLAESLFTPSGTRRLRQIWRLPLDTGQEQHPESPEACGP